MSSTDVDQSQTETEDVSSNQEVVTFPSGELLLSVIQKEYDYETARKTALETRAGIFIPFIAAILTFVVSYVKVDQLKKIKITYAIEGFYYSVYMLLGIASIGLLVTALIYFIKVLTAYEYKRLVTAELSSEKHGGFAKDVLAMAFAEKYRDIIEHNHSLNGKKAKHYQRGCYVTFAAIITTILVYGISQNI